MAYMAYELGLKEIAQKAGMPFWTVLTIVFWTVFWKLFGLWKSARNNHSVWFIVIALVNTVGILPIIYVFGFSGMNFKRQDSKTSKKSSKSNSH